MQVQPHNTDLQGFQYAQRNARGVNSVLVTSSVRTWTEKRYRTLSDSPVYSEDSVKLIMSSGLKPKTKCHIYASCSLSIAVLGLPDCTWKVRFDPITVLFGYEEGVEAYLPPRAVICHNKVLVGIVGDNHSDGPGLFRVHSLPQNRTSWHTLFYKNSLKNAHHTPRADVYTVR